MAGSRPPRVLVLIPARGGSTGIPRKNLRALAGEPLVAYAIRAALASRFAPRVLVSSEDDEILAIAAKYGADPHRRSAELAGDATTIDEVTAAALSELSGGGERYDLVVTVQPTSPLLRTGTLDEAIDRMLATPELDTVISATEDRHLRWEEDAGSFRPLYERRVNRQQLPLQFRETGAFVVCRPQTLARGSRIGQNVSLFPLSGGEAIDIDTLEDWNLAEWHLARRQVLFVVAGYPEIGLGHVYNALTVATDLTRHDLAFLVDDRSDLAAGMIEARRYPTHRQRSSDLLDDVIALGPDVVINDRLDTDREYVAGLKARGMTVINFEDLGSGAAEADLVINAIYPESRDYPNHHAGPRYFCARTEFAVTTPRPVSDRVERILVTFGGTDPNDMTRRVLAEVEPLARERGIAIDVVLGLGYAHEPVPDERPEVRVHRSVAAMSDFMRSADLVFTSAGRTAFEVACLGTPAVVIAQNARELTHLFASPEHGFVNLGLGSELAPGRIGAELVRLLDDQAARRRMSDLMLETDLRHGTRRVVDLIERTISESWASQH